MVILIFLVSIVMSSFSSLVLLIWVLFKIISMSTLWKFLKISLDSFQSYDSVFTFSLIFVAKLFSQLFQWRVQRTHHLPPMNKQKPLPLRKKSLPPPKGLNLQKRSLHRKQLLYYQYQRPARNQEKLNQLEILQLQRRVLVKLSYQRKKVDSQR